MKPEVDAPIRITQQFRSGQAMVYDLRDKIGRLTLRLSQRQSDTDPGDYRFDASTGTGPEAIVVTGWGATRADALRDAALSWSKVRVRSGLPAFDWDVVTRVLSAVRAV